MAHCKTIIILTGSELRHDFFRKFVAAASGIVVLASYCEGVEKSLRSSVDIEENNLFRLRHITAREESERDFFELFVTTTIDRSHPIHIPKGDINKAPLQETITLAKPDLLVAYGCSIIRGPLLDAFRRRFINVHLGLSPYYRGVGTNYWPLVNGEPEYVGATFMHIDPGIDTGEIIHQIRARVLWGDTPSQIGNRLIRDMATVNVEIIRKFEQLTPMPQPPRPSSDRFYRQRDYDEESVRRLYHNFHDGIVEKYINEERDRCAHVPIVSHPLLS